VTVSSRRSWSSARDAGPDAREGARGRAAGRRSARGDEPLTRWAVLLLAAYLALALMDVDERRAVRIAVVATAAVMVGVGVKHGAL
jgi:hypothetical protein